MDINYYSLRFPESVYGKIETGHNRCQPDAALYISELRWQQKAMSGDE